MFSHDTSRRLFVTSKPNNRCFTWRLTHLATYLMFSPVDALFLEHKVHNSSSSLHLCTQKIIGHSELCNMAHRCDQLTLKVVFTVYPAMLYPLTSNNFATK